MNVNMKPLGVHTLQVKSDSLSAVWLCVCMLKPGADTGDTMMHSGEKRTTWKEWMFHAYAPACRVVFTP